MEVSMHLETELTEVKRKRRLSMVNMKGVVSHDEMCRMENKAITMGAEVKISMSMMRCRMGSRCEWGQGVMTDPAVCNAVDGCLTKIEPVPPGRPKQKYRECQHEMLLQCDEACTTKRNCEHCISFIMAQNTVRCTGDNHHTKKQVPACAEQGPDVLISSDDMNGCNGVKGDDSNDDVGAAVPIQRVKTLGIAPNRNMVMRSLKQEVMGGTMLSVGRTCEGTKDAPGSQPNFWQRATRPDTSELRTTTERQAADFAVHATTTNLEQMVTLVPTE
jgi:hypothetical protein